MERLIRWFEYLRSRPEHERRIIGASLWLAIAAILLSLWIASFRQSLNFGQPAYPDQRPEQKSVSPQSAGVTLPAELPSPLKSLFGGFEEFQIRLEEVSRKIQDQLEKLQLPQPVSPNQPLNPPRPDKTLPEESGSKIEFIARIQKWIKGASNVFNSLIETLAGLGRK